MRHRTVPSAAMVAAALFIGGCGTTNPNLTPEQQAEQKAVQIVLTVNEACKARDAAVKTLTPIRKAGGLTDAQIETVDLAYAPTTDICDGDPPTSVAEAVQVVNNATAQLMLIVAGGKED